MKNWMKNWMKNGLLMLILPWLLAGCVLERFALPNDYAPKHPGATTPLADGAVFKGVADPKKGGEIFLRFVKTGPAQYVAEHFVAMPDGEDIALAPAHVRFILLGGAHYALYWKRIGEEPKQGYALVRLGAGRLQVLEPMSQTSTLALAKAYGIAAQPPGLVGGYTFDTRDEARVLKFFRDLSVRKTEATLTLAATKQVPADLRTRTYAKLGEYIPRLKRNDLGSEADAAAVTAWAQRLAREGDGHGHHLLARLSANGWGMSADGAAAIREAEAAVNKGVPQAAHVIAAMHYYGVGVPADPARALPYAQRAAEAGSPGAMLLLGFAYGNGRGVTQDHEAAKRWLQRAMDSHYGPAFAQWADLVLTEKTEAADRVALPAIERGVAHNDARAHVLRGVFHENGRAGPRDMDAAMKHFLAAAELGDAYAQYLVGHRLRHGQHIAQDIPRGRALLAEAARAGFEDAKKALAQPDPAPVKQGCVEDWCKDALAFTDAHLSELKLKMRKLRAELGKCPEVKNANLSCVPLDKAPPASRNADGSLRVVYFFAYACPKCAALNPFMREWSDSRRVFVWRIHALMSSSPWGKNMVRTHYALKSLDAAEVLGKAMFDAARAKRHKFSGVEEFTAFAHANGLDAGKAKTAFVSGAAGDDLDNATHASRMYKIASVPEIFVNGRYKIDIRKTDADTLRELAVLLDELVAQERLVER